MTRIARKPATQPERQWFVYVGKCADGSLYTGVTTDVARRARQHNDGSGAKYTRSRGGIRILHVEQAASKSAAFVREYEIKQLTRAKKLALVSPKTRRAPARGRTDARRAAVRRRSPRRGSGA